MYSKKSRGQTPRKQAFYAFTVIDSGSFFPVMGTREPFLAQENANNKIVDGMDISATTVTDGCKVSQQEVVPMHFFEAVLVNFRKYATFSGKATRSEFWFWILFVVIASTICNVLDEALFPTRVEEMVYPLGICFNLVTFLPGLAVGARRLHDVGRSGWWQLLGLTLIGFIPLLWWWVKKGTTNTFADQSIA